MFEVLLNSLLSKTKMGTVSPIGSLGNCDNKFYKTKNASFN